MDVQSSLQQLCALRELRLLRCPFVLPEDVHALRMHAPLAKLALMLYNGWHLLEADTRQGERKQARRQQAPEDLAAHDERFRYTRAELLSMSGYCQGVPGVTQLPEGVECMLSELDLNADMKPPAGSGAPSAGKNL